MLCCVLIIAIGIYRSVTKESLSWRFVIDDVSQVNRQQPPKFERIFNHTVNTVAHSPTVALLNSQKIRLMWFQGSREGGEDVAIWISDLQHSNNRWQHSKARPFLSPHTIDQHLQPTRSLTTLGNTVQFGTDPNKYLTTVVSLGGWAMASIAFVNTQNNAKNPVQAAHILPLSPYLNRSHLVRSPTIAWQDGDIGLPAYFEIATYFGVLVRLGQNGQVKDQRTISRGKLGIQPVIVVLDSKRAVALLRNFADTPALQDRLVASWTDDGGQSWSQAELLDVPNPSSPVAALRLSDGKILMGFNDHKDCADLFRLALSADDGRTWQRIATLEAHQCNKNHNVRYPTLRRLANGDIILTYSFNNKGGIRAFVFNESWLMQQHQLTQKNIMQQDKEQP